ncbi:flagellar protein FlaG [Oceanobacter mangrovi]|uniref:flagellar protein FlaG n=1 Tax=Oceanobacter mangrovi TaxID=2862510 RepID=UPI001FE28BD3|nr:flagellar protein FlaG [Oceanobacter mangrovi]
MNEFSMDRPDLSSLGASNKVTSMYQANTGKTIESGKALPAAGTEGNKPAAVNAEQVQEAVSRINEYVQQSERSLEFRLDEHSGKTIIRVYDKSSEELIRQIPSELAVELAQKLNDEEPSLLFSAQV